MLASWLTVMVLPKAVMTENMAKFGTVAVLVHWPRGNVDIHIFTPSTLSNNPLPKS